MTQPANQNFLDATVMVGESGSVPWSTVGVGEGVFVSDNVNQWYTGGPGLNAFGLEPGELGSVATGVGFANPFMGGTVWSKWTAPGTGTASFTMTLNNPSLGTNDWVKAESHVWTGTGWDGTKYFPEAVPEWDWTNLGSVGRGEAGPYDGFFGQIRPPSGGDYYLTATGILGDITGNQIGGPLVLNVVAGQTYFFETQCLGNDFTMGTVSNPIRGGFGIVRTFEFSGTLNWTSVLVIPATPGGHTTVIANDDIAFAMVLTGGTGSVAFDLTEATFEGTEVADFEYVFSTYLLEDAPAVVPGDLWYIWTPPNDQFIRFNITSREFMRAYIVDPLGQEASRLTVRDLIPVTWDTYTTNATFIEFSAQAGVSYYIQLMQYTTEVLVSSSPLVFAPVLTESVGTLSWETYVPPGLYPYSDPGGWSEWITPPVTNIALVREGYQVADAGKLTDPASGFAAPVWMIPTFLDEEPLALADMEYVPYPYPLAIPYTPQAQSPSWSKARNGSHTHVDVHAFDHDAIARGAAGAVYDPSISHYGSEYWVTLGETRICWSIRGTRNARPVPTAMASLRLGVDYAPLPTPYINDAAGWFARVNVPIVEWDQHQVSQLLPGGAISADTSSNMYTAWSSDDTPVDFTAVLTCGAGERLASLEATSPPGLHRWTSGVGTPVWQMDHTLGPLVSSYGPTGVQEDNTYVDNAPGRQLISDLTVFLHQGEFTFSLVTNTIFGEPKNGGLQSGSFGAYSYGIQFYLDNLTITFPVQLPRYRYWIPSLTLPGVLEAAPDLPKVHFYNPWG